MRKKKKYLLQPVIEDQAMMKIASVFSSLFKEEDPSLQNRYFFPITGEDNLKEERRLFRRLKGFKHRGYLYQHQMLTLNRLGYTDVAFSNFSLFFWGNKKWKINSKEELLSLRFNDVVVGDIIYDTYLRFKHRSTVDINDPALQDVINYAWRLSKRINRYLGTGKVAAVLTPYTAYTHWGLLAKIALAKNIPVYTFGAGNYLLQQIGNHHPFHSKDYTLYREKFMRLDDKDKEEGLLEAGNALTKRLSGVIDSGIQFMKQSAFNTEAGNRFVHEGNKPFAIIFAHCFFDSPHIYGELLFADFYEWLRYVLTNASQQTDVVYYLKPHPNGIKGNTEIIAELIKKFDYPNIILLDSSISNIELINSKPNAVFSVYGSVGHEFSFAGIPVVLGGENPHRGYEFCYNPATQEELKKFVWEVGQYGLPADYDKKDIVEFFFMHFMYLAKGIYNHEMKKIKDFETGYCFMPADKTVKEITFSKE